MIKGLPDSSVHWWLAAGLAFAAMAGSASAQDQQGPGPDAAVAEDAEQQGPPPSEADKESFFDKFKDDEDGKLDFSKFLARGGFVPVPVIITEPAVDGGFGVVAQFITMNPDNPKDVTRRALGAVMTGNGSYGIGAFQSGKAFDEKVKYKVGVGLGEVNLTAYPAFAPDGFEYSNKYHYALLASALWQLPDDRFSIGPMVDFRKITSTVGITLPNDLELEFSRTLKIAAVGGGVHFDGRNNALTPTEGFNGYLEAKFYTGFLGSDRNFESYKAHGYAFHTMSPDWRLGMKTEVDFTRGDYPIYFAPAINLRGVEASHYQGETVVSTELELTRVLNSRWSVLAFAGFGEADAGSSRFLDDSGAKFAGGAGFRYRIARLLGLDAGVDIAYGPGGTIFYLQFGHAWGTAMD